MRIEISEDVLFQEVGGETVLLDLASEQYFGLDAVGTRIWQLLGEGADREEPVSQEPEQPLPLLVGRAARPLAAAPVTSPMHLVGRDGHRVGEVEGGLGRV